MNLTDYIAGAVIGILIGLVAGFAAGFIIGQKKKQVQYRQRRFMLGLVTSAVILVLVAFLIWIKFL